jgi:hypothetical protein
MEPRRVSIKTHVSGQDLFLLKDYIVRIKSLAVLDQIMQRKEAIWANLLKGKMHDQSRQSHRSRIGRQTQS